MPLNHCIDPTRPDPTQDPPPIKIAIGTHLDSFYKGRLTLPVLLDNGFTRFRVADVRVEVAAVGQFSSDGGKSVLLDNRRSANSGALVYVEGLRRRIAKGIRAFQRSIPLAGHIAQIDDLTFVNVTPAETPLVTTCKAK